MLLKFLVLHCGVEYSSVVEVLGTPLWGGVQQCC